MPVGHLRALGSPPRWFEPSHADAELATFVRTTIEQIMSTVPAMPAQDPSTGLCEKPVKTQIAGEEFSLVCTLPRTHRDRPCQALDTRGRDVLEALAKADPDGSSS